MDINRVEEFSRDGKNFIYIDFSELRENDEFRELVKYIEPVIAKYPPQSVYTITNIENVRFDTNSKELVAAYMERNKPYVKNGAVIGLDGIKKLMVNAVFSMSGRKKLLFAFTKEQAVEMLLKND